VNNRVAKFEFDVTITNDDRLKFAELSGDWNPLHTNAEYAQSTQYGSCVLHGAFSAGLFSRMAGMVFPGKSCLLHGMQLKFIKPIMTPVDVRVIGEVVRDNGVLGEVKCRVESKVSGILLVEGVYQFGRHECKSFESSISIPVKNREINIDKTLEKTIVTGSAGSMGETLLELLGDEAVSLRHKDLARLSEEEILAKTKLQKGLLSNIVHCGWPEPNNVMLTDLTNARLSISEQVGGPLEDIIKLARLIKKYGKKNGSFIVIGSSYSNPGSHGWRFPLYSLAKGMLVSLTKILACELAPKGINVVGVSLDVISGGMNRSMTEVVRQMNADRTLTGELPSMGEVVRQIEWILNNPGRLISGSFIDLTGGAQP